jgi:zinc transporter ZupT
MNISRQLGILIFCGVPAIVGGGIVYAIFGTYPPVAVYEILLLLVAGGLVRK